MFINLSNVNCKKMKYNKNKDWLLVFCSGALQKSGKIVKQIKYVKMYCYSNVVNIFLFVHSSDRPGVLQQPLRGRVHPLI